MYIKALIIALCFLEVICQFPNLVINSAEAQPKPNELPKEHIIPKDYQFKKNPLEFNRPMRGPKSAKQRWREQFEKCKMISPSAQIDPAVHLISNKPDGKINKGIFKVSGTVNGYCIADAAIYQDNERIHVIKVMPTTSYRRFKFTFSVDSDKDPEIRVFTVFDKRVHVKLANKEPNDGAKK